MEAISVNCNNCGAPLQVGAGINFVTCQHCASRLAIKRTESATYTELLEKIDRMTDAVAGQLAEITRQNEVARIDREWEQERQAYLMTNKQGIKHEPTIAGGWMVAVFMGGLGLLWLSTMRQYMKTSPQFLIFVIVFIVAAVCGGLWRMNRAQEYQAAKARYERRRTAALLGWPDEPYTDRK